MPEKYNENISAATLNNDLLSELFRVLMEIILAFRIPEYKSSTRQLITHLETLREINSYNERKEAEYIFIGEMINKLIEKLNMIHEENVHNEKNKEIWESIRNFILDCIKKFEILENTLANSALEKQIHEIKKQLFDQIRNQLMLDIGNLNIQIERNRSELAEIQARLYNRFDVALNTIPPRQPFSVHVMNELGVRVPVNVNPVQIQDRFKVLIRDEINNGNREPDCMSLVRNTIKDIIENNLERAGYDIDKFNIDHAVQSDSIIKSIGMELQQLVDKINEDPDTQQKFDICDQLCKDISALEAEVEAKENLSSLLGNTENIKSMSFDELFAIGNMVSSEHGNENDSFSNKNKDEYNHFDFDSKLDHDHKSESSSRFINSTLINNGNHNKIATSVENAQANMLTDEQHTSANEVSSNVSNSSKNIKTENRSNNYNHYNGIESKARLIKKSDNNVYANSEKETQGSTDDLQGGNRSGFKK